MYGCNAVAVGRSCRKGVRSSRRQLGQNCQGVALKTRRKAAQRCTGFPRRSRRRRRAAAAAVPRDAEAVSQSDNVHTAARTEHGRPLGRTRVQLQAASGEEEARVPGGAEAISMEELARGACITQGSVRMRRQAISRHSSWHGAEPRREMDFGMDLLES